MSAEETQYFDELPENLRTQFELPDRTVSEAQTLLEDRNIQAVKREEADIPVSWKPGNVILGTYEVLDILGGGGFGIVYKVRHRGWNVDMAVKSPRKEALQIAGGVDAVVREAKTWIDLGLHPNIVPCYYVRVLGGIPRVFTEYIEGGSLLDWIERSAFSDLLQMLDVLIQFVSGLEYAHHCGLIHRDVKPGNVMMTPDGAARVTDFGLAQIKSNVSDAPGGTQEKSDFIALTRAYCSPEQAKEHALFLQGIDRRQWPEVSQASDIWSWAVSVLHMFIGECTWLTGVAAPDVLNRYLKGDSNTGSIPRMPAKLVDLLKECLVNEPERRLSDFGEISKRLIDIYQQTAGFSYGRENPRQLKLRADALNNHALSMVDLGQIETARELWHEALQVSSDHFTSQYNLTMMDWRTGRQNDEKVIKQFKNWQAKKPDDWRRVYLEACAQAERRQFSQARALLKPLLKAHPEQSQLKNLEKLLADRQLIDFNVKDEFGRTTHLDGIYSLDVDADRRIAVTSSKDLREVKVWDLNSDRCLQTITNTASNGEFYKVRLLMVYNAVVVMGRSQNGIWCHFYDIKSGKLIGLTPWEGDYGFSPNKRFMITGGTQPVVWDLQPLRSGKAPKSLHSIPFPLDHPGINDTGTRVMGIYNPLEEKNPLFSNQTFISYALYKIKFLLSKEISTALAAVHYCSDGDHVYIMRYLEGELRFNADHSPTELWGAKYLELWNLETNLLEKTVQTKMWSSWNPEKFEFLPENRVCITIQKDPNKAYMVAPENFVNGWDLDTGKQISSFFTGDCSLTCMRADHDLLALGDRDGMIKFVDLSAMDASYSAPLEYSRLQTLNRTQENLKQYAVLLDKAKDAKAAGDYPTAVRRLRQVRELPGYARDERAFALWQQMYLRQPKLAFKSGDSHRLFRKHQYRKVAPVDNEFIKLAALTLNFPGNLREGYQKVLLLNSDKEEELINIQMEDEDIHSFDVDFSKKELILGTESGRIMLWSLEKNKSIRRFKISGDFRKPQVHFSPDGHTLFFLSVFGGGLVVDRTNGKTLLKIPGHPKGALICSAVNRTGTKLLLGKRKEYGPLLIDLPTLKSTVLKFLDPICLCFSPDDTCVYVGFNNGKVIAYNLDPQGGELIGEHKDRVNTLSISADGHFLITGCADGSACIWDIKQKQKAWEFFTPHDNAVTDVGFTGDGRFGYVVAEDIHVWELDWELGEKLSTDWDPAALEHLKNFVTPRFRAKPTRKSLFSQQKKPKLDDETVRSAQQYLAECGFGYLTREGITQQINKLLSAYQE